MNYGFYASGGASRILKLKEDVEFKETFLPKIKLIIYDGSSKSVTKELQNLSVNQNMEILHISYNSLNPKSHNENTFLSNEMLKKFSKHKIDYCFCFGSKILVGKLLEAYRNKIINFHPSLLPSYPGLNAIDKAIEGNSLLLGNTAHFIDEKVDTGPIIMQSILPISLFNHYEDVLSLQIPMLLQIIRWLEEDRLVIESGRVIVRNARYKTSNFIPNLEQHNG